LQRLAEEAARRSRFLVRLHARETAWVAERAALQKEREDLGAALAVLRQERDDALRAKKIAETAAADLQSITAARDAAVSERDTALQEKAEAVKAASKLEEELKTERQKVGELDAAVKKARADVSTAQKEAEKVGGELATARDVAARAETARQTLVDKVKQIEADAETDRVALSQVATQLLAVNDAAGAVCAAVGLPGDASTVVQRLREAPRRIGDAVLEGVYCGSSLAIAMACSHYREVRAEVVAEGFAADATDELLDDLERAAELPGRRITTFFTPEQILESLARRRS
jgi:seryl-tRNA synthetase